MRVEHVAIKEFSGQVTGARSATTQWAARQGMIVQVRTPDGLLGQGESTPLPGFSPDDYGRSAAAIRNVDWDSVPEPDPSQGGDALFDLLASVGGSMNAPSARFAVETAFLDVLGQRARRPIWRILSDLEGTRSRVPLSALLGDADDPEIVGAARRAIERGVAGVKLKVAGLGTEARLARIRAVRHAIGAAGLRLDANGSLPPQDAGAELQKFREVDVEFVEEPVPSPALASLTDPAVPIALDESLQSPAHWALVEPRLKQLRCRALVIKPMALGGFSAGLRWARAARIHGVDAVVSHLFDGPIALTACAHLAVAIASRRYGSGLDLHGGLQAWPGVEFPWFSSGAIVGTDRPGLGIPPLGGDGP